MNCAFHPEVEAVGMCTTCGRAICGECRVEVQGRLSCRECLSTGRAVAQAARPAKDRSIAIVLEVLPGFFGFLGFGWIYAGNTTAGILWLIGYLVWFILAAIVSAATGGLGCFLTLPFSIVVLAVSASSLNSYTRQHPELFGA